MRSNDNLTINMMQALYGDAIHVRYFGTDNQFHNIFIDGGFPVRTYRATIRHQTQQVLNSNELIDLFIITHIDQDHIGGVLAFVKEFGSKDIVDAYWFNDSSTPIKITPPSSKIGVRQGIELREYLSANSLQTPIAITSDLGKIQLPGGATATILAPRPDDLMLFQKKWENEEAKQNRKKNKIGASVNDYHMSIEVLIERPFAEDRKLVNKVSISFIFRLGASSILFLADSQPSTIIHALRGLGYSEAKPLKVDHVKVAHHGSKHNTNTELLTLIDSRSFLISANGNNPYNFPHKELLARILRHPNRSLDKPIEFIFNYDNAMLRSIFTAEEQKKLNFSCHFPPHGTNGYTIHCNTQQHD